MLKRLKSGLPVGVLVMSKGDDEEGVDEGGDEVGAEGWDAEGWDAKGDEGGEIGESEGTIRLLISTTDILKSSVYISLTSCAFSELEAETSETVSPFVTFNKP